MVVANLASMVLRLAELAFAAIVAGLTGKYLHATKGATAWQQGRFIYTEVGRPVNERSGKGKQPDDGENDGQASHDLGVDERLLRVCFVCRILIGHHILTDFDSAVFDWSNVGFNGAASCSELKASLAFSFLSAILWLVSALLGLYWVRKHTRTAAPAATTYRRRRWYRSRV